MTILIIIFIVTLLCYFIFRERPTIEKIQNATKEKPADQVVLGAYEGNDIARSTPDIYYSAEGREYYIEMTEVQIPRKTYIKGLISGKYRGELIYGAIANHNTKDYEFEIYEAEISCSETRRDVQFTVDGFIFPKEKLPQTLPVQLVTNEKVYILNILEPELYSFTPNKKLHQTDGHEIFGSFTGEITGYILDYVSEWHEKPIFLDEVINQPFPEPTNEVLRISDVETGRVERKPPYIRKEYLATNLKDTMWGTWRLENVIGNPPASQGCFSLFIRLFGLIIGLLFVLFVLPQLGYFILFFIVLYLIQFIGPFVKWLSRFLAIILILAFGYSIYNSATRNTIKTTTSPTVVDKPTENTETVRSIVENYEPEPQTTNEEMKRDSIIKRHRIWQNYDGTVYEGTYFIRLSDYRSSSNQKKSMHLYNSTINAYDQIVYNLKENDKNRIEGLYKLFDSINNENKLSRIEFAEMVGSFVQDIPYSLILDDNCDPNLYDDAFTRKYLLSAEARCLGNQRFGINTPVEFLGNLYGDCDTRTLLLYTIFAHYDYDVAMLSSEFYRHSIIGINLPINGTSYTYHNQRYVLWETTVPNLKPGVINNEISNLNNWRISLKSK